MKELLLLFATATLGAPPKQISQSSDSVLFKYTVSQEEYELLQSQLFTYQQIAAIRKKHIEKLTQKLKATSYKDSDGTKKRKKIRIKVKKKSP